MLSLRDSKSIYYLASLLFTLAVPAFGQVPIVHAGSFEVGGFAGASYGVLDFRAMGGGNVTYGLSKWLLPYAEYSYFPAIGTTITTPVTAAKSTFALPLSDFNGGVHLRIPIRESRIVPYVVVAVGALKHFKSTYTVTYTGADGLPHTLTGPFPSGSFFTFNGGGGLRFYMTERFGMRLEAKVYKPNSRVVDAFGKVEAGFFFQLR